MSMVVVKVYNADDGIPEGSPALPGTLTEWCSPGGTSHLFTPMQGLPYTGLPMGMSLSERAYRETNPHQLPSAQNQHNQDARIASHEETRQS